MHDKRLPFASKKVMLSTVESNSAFSFLVPDQDQVLSQITDDPHTHDQLQPYWAEHWPSAQVFINYLAKAELSPSMTVCELGSGLGVISSFLMTKCKFVVATDISHHACQFAKVNTEPHGVPRVLCCDWRSMPFKAKFDLIIGSDILYEARWIGPVLSAIKALVKKGGYALIADPKRKDWQTFKEDAMEQNLIVDTVFEGPSGKSVVEIVRIT